MRKRWLIILTIINLILLIIGTVCFVGTSINNKIINSIEGNFTYREEKGEVVFQLKNGEDIPIRFGENSAKITILSTVIDRKAELEIVMFIKKYASQHGFSIKRDVTELYGELRLHYFLNALGYKKSHTEDCDLDYVSDKRWYVNVVSKVIGWIEI